MDPHAALEYAPPDEWMRLTVIDSHTGGEPFRVVVDGFPELPGTTVLERRSYARDNYDHVRKLLMWEPRGHADMYGGIIGPPERDDSDLSVLFIHNDGFSTMCGHGVIALAKVLIDTGMVSTSDDEHSLRIDTPAGLVIARSEIKDASVSGTRFRNVLSFAPLLDARVATPTLGAVTFDLAYGGAFYAYVDTQAVGVSLDDVATLVRVGREIKEAVSRQTTITHPDSRDLGFLYGVIFTGPPLTEGAHSRNVCVFADGEVDRSPTGTGVSGRLAIMHARGEVDVDVRVTVESMVGSTFEGRIVAIGTVGEHTAIVPEISGSAHIVGRSEFWVDPKDEVGKGFLVR